MTPENEVPVGKVAETTQDALTDLRERMTRLEAEVARLKATSTTAQSATRYAPAPPPPPRLPISPAQEEGFRPLPSTNATPAMLAFSSAMEPKRDLETRLGSQVLSKIAILLLLAGSAWFLKWTFDNHWIGPLGRVLIGLIAGCGVMLWSERFRHNGTPAFSYVLKALGAGVLYLSLWAGFQLYSLMPAAVAMLGMVMVTAWMTFMALTQDSLLLAAYALMGAYLTPVLASTGINHEVSLFAYLIIVAASLLALLHYKPWKRLLIGPVVISTVYVVLWLWGNVFYTDSMRWKTVLLETLLWGTFAAVPLVALQTESALVNVISPVITALCGSGLIFCTLADTTSLDARPWAAVLFAAAYLGLARSRRSAVASAVHLSLGISFLMVAVPLKMTGHGISLGWLVEAAAVLWLATRPSLEPPARAALSWLGIVAAALGVIGAIVAPGLHEQSTVAVPFLNRSFATEVAALALLAMLIWISKQFVTGVAWAPGGEVVRLVAFSVFQLVLAVTMYREISLIFHSNGYAHSNGYEATTHALALQGFAFSGWLAIQGAAMLALGFWKREVVARWTGLILLAITLLKTVIYDMTTLNTGYRVASYLALGSLLLAVSYAYQNGLLNLGEVTQVEDEEK